jgi:hypothetical protein
LYIQRSLLKIFQVTASKLTETRVFRYLSSEIADFSLRQDITKSVVLEY